MGSLSCLSVADGDITIKFDTQNASEAIRAKRIITDMLKRGYALLIKMADGSYVRAVKFNEKQGEYIIADFDPSETNEKIETEKITSQTSPTLKKKRGRKAIPMQKADAVAVAPSAGG